MCFITVLTIWLKSRKLVCCINLSHREKKNYCIRALLFNWVTH